MDNKPGLVHHSLEQMFNVSEQTTEHHNQIIARKTDVSHHDQYDDKDIEIEQQYQEIADLALTAYDSHVSKTVNMFGKLHNESQEVSSQLLTTALNALKEKANIKQHKDKMSRAANNPSKVTNIIIDRNELLRNILDQTNVYDGEVGDKV